VLTLRLAITVDLCAGALALSLLLHPALAAAQSPPAASRLIDLNAATSEQLATLPGIGPTLASRIIEHRLKHGPFKRPQDVIVVRGMSARRFRRIAPFIRT
jgi:competence protein ComEA